MRVLVPVCDYYFGSFITHFLVRHTWPSDVEFRIINVIEPFALGSSSQAPFHRLLDHSAEQILADANELVQTIAQSIRKFTGAPVMSEVLVGPVSDTLSDCVERWKPALIVMGSHGRRGWDRLFLGSVSLTLLSESSCPVLIVRPSKQTVDVMEVGVTEDLSASGNQPQKILLAIDQEVSDDSNFLALLQAHKWGPHSDFEIVSVYEPYKERSSLGARDCNERKMAAIFEHRARVHQFASQLTEVLKDVSVEELIVEGDPKSKLIDIAQTWGADVIVVGDKSSKNKPKQIGSVAYSVLCGASCSVLVLRTQADNMHLGNKSASEVSVTI